MDKIWILSYSKSNPKLFSYIYYFLIINNNPRINIDIKPNQFK
jgi:hypothetical protein